MTRRRNPSPASQAGRQPGDPFARHVSFIMEQDGLTRSAAALRVLVEGEAGLRRREARETDHPEPPASKDAPASPKGTKP